MNPVRNNGLSVFFICNRTGIINNYILNIYPRKNELLRPPVSNIDQAVIVTSVAYPNLDLNLLDKLISIIEFHNIKPIICFTKLDLLKTTILLLSFSLNEPLQSLIQLIFNTYNSL